MQRFREWLTDELLAHDNASYHTPYQAERALRLTDGCDTLAVFDDGACAPTREDRPFLVRALKEALLVDGTPELAARLEGELRLATGAPDRRARDRRG